MKKLIIITALSIISIVSTSAFLISSFTKEHKLSDNTGVECTIINEPIFMINNTLRFQLVCGEDTYSLKAYEHTSNNHTAIKVKTTEDKSFFIDVLFYSVTEDGNTFTVSVDGYAPIDIDY